MRGSLALQRRVLERLTWQWRRARGTAPSRAGGERAVGERGPLGAGEGQAMGAHTTAPSRALEDPLFLVRPYGDPADQEVAGMIAALLAYGRVEAVCRTVAWVLDRLAPSPREALLEGRHLEPDWGAGFRYRFNTRRDLRRWLEAMALTLRREGSLGQALAERRRRAGDLAGGLDLWARDLRGMADDGGRPSGGLKFLLPDPSLGGACKRWWLYLRWMVRPADGLDLGVWSALLPAAELRVPLDAHWIRIGPRLGLTARRTPNAAMALEITDGLRRLDAADPLRHDYAVCHLGMSGRCPPTLRPSDCRSCPLRQICTHGRRMLRHSGRS